MKIFSHIKMTFGLDYRSLALYRALMGLIIIADVLYRLSDLTNFYTDVGLIPRSIFTGQMSMPWSFSLHLANGSLPFIVLMFAIHFIFGVMLLFGYHTRWAIFGVWLMTTSIHNRNWLVNNGGDDILRAILFISIFLPLNRCFSMDSALTEKKDLTKGPLHFSTWGLTFFLQVFVIYFVSYILKDHPIWRSDFTALYYASRLDIFANSLGVWYRDFPIFLKTMTIFTIYLEWLGPLLLIFSFAFGRFWWAIRLFVIAMFWFLHLGIILTMWIGVFPYLCLVMWLIFLPTPLWELIIKKFQSKDFAKLAIYYDGDCGFCKKGVLLIREFFLLPEVLIAPTQNFPELNSLMLKENSWVVVNEKGERFFHFAAFIEVMKHSPLMSWVVPILSAKPVFSLFTSFYKWVARSRQLISHYSQLVEFRQTKKEIVWPKWIYQATGAFIFITLLMWNLTTIKKWQIQAPFFQTVTRWAHLYQEWNMFAPFPKMDNIWVEIPATLSDGSVIELLTGDRDIYTSKGDRFPHVIPNEHWRKFYLNLSERSDYANYYGSFLCRLWNDRNERLVKETTLRKFEIIVYSQLNLPNDEKGTIERKLSWNHWCFDEDYQKEAGK
jgi:predicted DCC family thiol-disulfide oxidoreductase YuxK